MKLIPTFLKSLFKTNEEELEKYRNSAEYKEWVNRYKSLVSTKPGERKTSYTRHKGVPRSWESRKFKTPNLASNASFGEPKKHQDSKGYNTGEENVKTQLELLKSKCWILHDITLKMDNGNTCQVDHVVISNFGVFVLETKKRKGTIVGAPNDLKWHVLNENGKYIESFYSPLKQNAVHTSRLVEKISGKVTTPFPVIPLLVFQEDDDYMMLSEGIVTPFSLVRKIANFNNRETNLSEYEMRMLYFFLKMENDKSQKTKNEHIERAKKAENRNSMITTGS